MSTTNGCSRAAAVIAVCVAACTGQIGERHGLGPGSDQGGTGPGSATGGTGSTTTGGSTTGGATTGGSTTGGATTGGATGGTTGGNPMSCTGPTVTRSPLRRLIRFEVNNTVRELLGVATNPADALPGEEAGNGFGNDADALG